MPVDAQKSSGIAAIRSGEISQNAPSSASANQSAGGTVQFDVSGMRSSYANVCTVSIMREEVVLGFGLNSSWERGPQAEQLVRLNDRIILTPIVAKRLVETVGNALRDYEKRFGRLAETPATAQRP